jgi:hypothetical protein
VTFDEPEFNVRLKASVGVPFLRVYPGTREFSVILTSNSGSLRSHGKSRVLKPVQADFVCVDTVSTAYLRMLLFI